jgi:KDO2-lipid IV(A) lauroyltransferase
MTTEPNQYEEGQLTLQYVKLLEKKIKLNPSNYLWSHRRWKYTFDPIAHEKLLVK